VLWLVYYLGSIKKVGWSWQESIPWILMVSMITTPVAWMHDGLIFAIPTIIISISLITKNRLAFNYWFVLFLLVNVFTFLLIPSFRVEQYVFYWLPYFFLIVFYLNKNDSLLNIIKPSPDMKPQ
jgi:hypothetical protein